MSQKVGSESVTQGIRIVASPRYLPSESAPDQGRFVFGYRITISNEGAQRARLLSRHWIIVDGDGERHEVRGPGVVGQTPDLAPGETFQYSSYCPLGAEWGTMEGSYLMQREDGEQFEATVARFYLVAALKATPTA